MKGYLEGPFARFGFVVVNVIAGQEVVPGDRDLFFGPLEPHDVFVNVPASWHVSKLLTHLGIFDSAKDAERHGYRGPIPDGFTDLLNITKARHRVTILNAREAA